MPSITVSHQNPGAVTRRLLQFQRIRSGNMEQKIIQDELDSAYQRVYKDARVRTGYMRSTIQVKSAPNTTQISVGAFYSVFVEKGTRHSRAYPFFFANIHVARDIIITELRVLWKGVI